jgi:hypothetical protein
VHRDGMSGALGIRRSQVQTGRGRQRAEHNEASREAQMCPRKGS